MLFHADLPETATVGSRSRTKKSAAEKSGAAVDLEGLAPAVAELPPRYRVVGRLGEGGMGLVVQVEDAESEPRRKALKLLHGTGDDLDARQALEDEFRLLRTLRHPHVARVYDFGTLRSGSAYYTAEVAEGHDLQSATDGAPAATVLRTLATLLRAVGYLHARGILHNDIKPSNVIVRKLPGALTLVDLGVAVRRQAGATGGGPDPRTSAGGTILYMAPERLRMQPFDQRSDVYSLGATVYRNLARCHAVVGETAAEVLDSLRRGVAPLRAFRDDVPEGADRLVQRMLALDPDERPTSAAEALAELGQALGEPLPLVTPEIAGAFAAEAPLVARAAQVGRIEDLARRAADPRSPPFAIVAGPPGSGRSRLLREVASRRQLAGWRVATATGRAGAPAFDVVDAVVQQLAQVAGGGGGEGGGASRHLAGDRQRVARVTDAASRIVAAADRWPVLVAVDDAHAADGSLWEVLAQVERRLRKAPARFVAVLALGGDVRPAEPEAWLDAGRAVRLDLPPLAAADVEGMLAAMFGAGAFTAGEADALAREAGGSPLVVEELVRALLEAGAIRPAGAGFRLDGYAARGLKLKGALRDLLAARMKRLSPGAVRLLEVLAIASAPVDEAAARRVGRLGEDEVAAAVAAGFAVREGGALLLPQPALAELALAAVASRDRRALASALADTISVPERQLPLLRRAGRDVEALAAAAQAAARAREAGDYPAARARVAEARALAVAGTPGDGESRLLIEEVDAEVRAAEGDRTGAESATLAALALAPDPERQARVLAAAMGASLGFGQVDRAAHWLARADKLGSLPPASRALLAPVAARLALERGDHALARKRLTEGEVAVSEIPAGETRLPVLRRDLADSAGVAALLAGDLAIGRQRLTAALALSQQVGDMVGVARAETNLATAALREGATAEAIGRLERAVAVDEACGLAGYHATDLLNLAMAYSDAGRDLDAERMARAALQMKVVSEHPGRRGPALSVLGEVLLFAGRPSEARLAVDEARRLIEGGGSGGAHERAAVLSVVAWAASFEGDGAGAREAAVAADKAAQASGVTLDGIWARMAAAIAATADSAVDPHVIADRLGGVEEELRGVGVRSTAARLAETAGDILLRGGAMAEGRRAFTRAAASFRAIGNEALASRCERRLAGGASDDGAATREIETEVAQLREENQRLRAEVRILARRAGGEGRTQGGGAGGSRASATRMTRLLEATLGHVEMRHPFAGVVGRSAPLRGVLQMLDRVVDTDLPVLLQGETGTGKEVLARAVHDEGPRRDSEFVALNCAAVPRSLAESELFGHRRGAFTGAERDHEGIFVRAAGGTVFLDEIGDMDLGLQSKVLRVIETRDVRPVGSEFPVRVDFRLLCATNRDLRAEVAAGRFREDLYYRIAVFEIALPPLRERVADIPALARHLLGRNGASGTKLAPAAQKLLVRYGWPGNVRELGNEMERAAVLSGGGVIHPEHLSPAVRSGVARSGAAPAPDDKRKLGSQIAALEKAILSRSLEIHRGNHSAVARQLGISRRGLLLKLRRHKL